MTFMPQLHTETLSETVLITSQADEIRAEHDRGKKRRISGFVNKTSEKQK